MWKWNPCATIRVGFAVSLEFTLLIFTVQVAQHSGDMDGVYGSQEDHMMEDDDWWDHHYHDREDFNISERIQVRIECTELKLLARFSCCTLWRK